MYEWKVDTISSNGRRVIELVYAKNFSNAVKESKKLLKSGDLVISIGINRLQLEDYIRPITKRYR